MSRKSGVAPRPTFAARNSARVAEPVILFRDRRYLVIDKPAGMAAHPGPSGLPNAEDWVRRAVPVREGPWLVHRLDADTAGCLVIALRKAALIAAQALFAAGRVEKTYWAVVIGAPTGPAGTVTVPIARRSAPGGWRMAADPGGQPAVTDWRVLGGTEGLTWLELCPRTGRTHQLRVHCAALGCPILGDARYGGGEGPLHLLARSIRLPVDPPVAAAAEPPFAQRVALSRCGWRGCDRVAHSA